MSILLSPGITVPDWLYDCPGLTAEDKWHYLHLCHLASDGGEWKADHKMLYAVMGIDAWGDVVVFRRFKRLVEQGLITVQHAQEFGPWSRGYRNVWTFRVLPHP